MAKSSRTVSPAKCKKILVDWAECRNYSEVGRKHNVSPNTVKAIVRRNPDVAKICKQKAEEQTQDAISHLVKRSGRMLELIDKLADAMDTKVTNLDMFTTLKDIGTTYGIVFDKLLRIHEIKRESGTSEGGVTIVDDL